MERGKRERKREGVKEIERTITENAEQTTELKTCC